MEENRLCIYCTQEVKDTEPYSMRKMGGIKRFWHYRCYTNNFRTMYELSDQERDYLISLVLEKEPNPDGMSLLAIRAIGYGK